MRGKQNIENLIKISAITFIFIPLTAFAFFEDNFFNDLFEGLEGESAGVSTSVNVRANTGGNASDGGEIITGDSSAKVYIENIVEDKETKPINLHIELEEEAPNQDGSGQATSSIINIEEEGIKVEASVEVGDGGSGGIDVKVNSETSEHKEKMAEIIDEVITENNDSAYEEAEIGEEIPFIEEDVKKDIISTAFVDRATKESNFIKKVFTGVKSLIKNVFSFFKI